MDGGWGVIGFGACNIEQNLGVQISQPFSHYIEISGLSVPVIAYPSEIPHLGIVRFTSRSTRMGIEKATVPVDQSVCFLLYL